MPQPHVGSVHVDRILTNISIAYMQAQSHFIANQVFPVVPVDKKTDIYFVFDQNAWFRDEMQRRAPGAESAGSGYTVSTDSYSCDVWALHKDIDDQTRANSDNPLNPDRNATQWLTQLALLRQEIQWVTDFFTTGVWGTSVTPSNLWSNETTSNPINDIETGKETILAATGFEPNRLVLGYQVYRQLKKHPDVVDRIKYTTAQVPTAALMAELFGVEKVLVAKAVKATNVENETAAYAFTHGKHALLAYSAPAPALDQPSAGYTMAWKGVSGSIGLPIAISQFRLERNKSDRVEIELAFDNKKVASALGYFFNGAVA